MAVFTEVKKEDLKVPGFKPDPIKSVYEELRLVKTVGDKKVHLILYTSGKLMVQGPTDEIKKITLWLKDKKIGRFVPETKFKSENGLIIGSDESLKGDTFGGLVVAAVKADDLIREKLIHLGVKDSKRLSDREVLSMASKIRLIAECEVKNIFPEEYNSATSITILLNKLHKECGHYLKPGKHIVDKYPGCNVGDVQEEKAEDKYVEVAAASVLARAAALNQLDVLSLKAGFHLPKGSTHVQSALQELKEQKLDFRFFVKLDFNNVQKFR